MQPRANDDSVYAKRLRSYRGAKRVAFAGLIVLVLTAFITWLASSHFTSAGMSVYDQGDSGWELLSFLTTISLPLGLLGFLLLFIGLCVAAIYGTMLAKSARSDAQK